MSFFFLIFIFERETAETGEGQRKRERENEPDPQALSHDCEIMTWAKLQSWMPSWLSHPGTPKGIKVLEKKISFHPFPSLLIPLHERNVSSFVWIPPEIFYAYRGKNVKTLSSTPYPPSQYKCLSFLMEGSKSLIIRKSLLVLLISGCLLNLLTPTPTVKNKIKQKNPKKQKNP